MDSGTKSIANSASSGKRIRIAHAFEVRVNTDLEGGFEIYAGPPLSKQPWTIDPKEGRRSLRTTHQIMHLVTAFGLMGRKLLATQLALQEELQKRRPTSDPP